MEHVGFILEIPDDMVCDKSTLKKMKKQIKKLEKQRKSFKKDLKKQKKKYKYRCDSCDKTQVELAELKEILYRVVVENQTSITARCPNNCSEDSETADDVLVVKKNRAEK